MLLGLKKKERKMLEYEVVSRQTRLKLTRLLRYVTNSDDFTFQTIKQNKYINIANNVLGLQKYVLAADDMGEYHATEIAWHNSQIEVIMQLPNTLELVEILADYLENDLLYMSDVNEILQDEGLSFSFKKVSNDKVELDILSIDEIEDNEGEEEHSNIRLLVNRMDNLLAEDDFSGVLHASASIFETLAKDIVNLPTIQNESLGGFFDRYRQDSGLPEPILDYILAIYRRRNKEPLAGHGSTSEPSISQEEAIILVEMTKSFVRIERQIRISQANI